MSPESLLIGADEGPVVRTYNAGGSSNVVLVCEHASRFIPKSLSNLGLENDAQESHVAWDIGALNLSLALMEKLDAPLIASCVSRLVYDCNRPPTALDAIPTRSERFDVPGNHGLSDDQIYQRTNEVYDPFHDAVSAVLRKRHDHPVLVTIHSFTPVYNGQPRSVELGLLHDTDAKLAEAMLIAAPAHTNLKTSLNEPYDARDGVTHTLQRHANPAGFLNVMIEVRNDLIEAEQGVRNVAADLAMLIQTAISTVDRSANENTSDNARDRQKI